MYFIIAKQFLFRITEGSPESGGALHHAKYCILDLLQLLRSSDAAQFEIAMLSALIVFKDVCPGKSRARIYIFILLPTLLRKLYVCIYVYRYSMYYI